MALCYPLARGLSKGHQGTKNKNSPTRPDRHAEVSQEQAGLKFIKKQGGTYIRAKSKREELSNVLATVRKAAAKED
ncbi:hypothetical protein FD754_002977 [Muntiacus muntjak]|uniref:Large ribosomal subunit protein eL36 n=1 Tax=Muntiacus muntjak TaxID=9888 RepID=A0A5N3WAU4_MUNMU|nr:hypothetical protein FD754_002977 [Muntiacus muntjak]